LGRSFDGIRLEELVGKDRGGFLLGTGDMRG
jgi:hypothetical protein